MPLDPNQLFDKNYYQHGCGLPYNRSEPHWKKFFDGIAQHIVKTLRPARVLDAGCAIGFLVEQLREYGIDAHGFDVSEYAISQAPEKLLPYLKVGSITDSDLYSENSFDLVVCIEVVEHLPQELADAAIRNLCRWGNMILFSSSPEDYNEATHFNVQLPGYWAEKFAQMNFLAEHNYDASYLTSWATLYRRQTPIWSSEIRSYSDRLWTGKKEIAALRNFVNVVQNQLNDKNAQIEQYQTQINLTQVHVNSLEGQIEQYQAHANNLQKQVEQAQVEYQEKLNEIQIGYKKAQSKIIETERQMDLLRSDFAKERQTLVDQMLHAKWASNHFEQRLITAEATLWKIQNSAGWRWILRYRSLKKKLFPVGSLQLKAYNALGAARRTLFREGPFALVNRTFKWLGGERRYKLKTEGKEILVLSPIKSGQYLFYAASDAKYAKHISRTEPDEDALKAQIQEVSHWSDKITFSIVTPVYAPPLEIFEEAAQTVMSQTYPNWEWWVGDATPNDTIWNYITKLADKDSRIKPIRIKENKGISENTNIALKEAKGEFIVLMDHDDVITPNALYEVMQILRVHPQADLIYSDEDKLDEKGYRCEPVFKSDWSPEVMLCANQITHLSVFRRSLLSQIGYLDTSTDGAQDWDLFFRITEVTSQVYHIPKVLYHWRKTPQSTAQNVSNKNVRPAQERAILNHLKRQGLKYPKVHFIDGHPINHVHPLATWEQRNKRKISIIIPSKDHAGVISRCLSSLFGLTQYDAYEVILVDTGSVEPDTFAIYEQYAHDLRFKVVNFTEPFNFSRACNFGAGHANGDLFLFLNNDIEVLHADWLDLMAQWFEYDEIGIVGARLLYPNGKIQHAGVLIGMGGAAAHLFIGEPENLSTIFGSDSWYRNLLAVTGACLMISRRAFETVKGFDENYKLNYSDIELCLQVHEAGYRTVYTPHARLIHHEGTTHQSYMPRADFERAYSRWQHWFRSGDPYFNCNLSYQSTYPIFQIDDDDTPLHVNNTLMDVLPYKDRIPYSEIEEALRLKAFERASKAAK